MKRLNFNIKDRKVLTLGLCLILVCVFTLTIAYAALSVTLNIQGSAEVVASTWDIHLENVKVKSGSVSGTIPSITTPTTASFSITLNMPGDFYEFTIDVVNNGSIDAMIDSVIKEPTLTTNQAKYLNYIIEYQNGESINTKQLVSKESFVRLKVRVEFRKDITASDLPTTSETLNLAFTVNYVQSDGSGSSVIDNGVYEPVKVVSGDLDTVGSVISIGSEKFYIISSDSETVTMLSKYNLLVGNKFGSSGNCVALENSTGIQDSTAIGWFNNYSDNNPLIGTKPFASTNYWSSTVSSYPSYVYNESSYLYEYVENYKTYLEGLEIPIYEARLINYEELETLGCSVDDYSCSGAPDWVYATSYWLGSAHKTDKVWYVLRNSSFYYRTYGYNLVGVRPVITISKSLF